MKTFILTLLFLAFVGMAQAATPTQKATINLSWTDNSLNEDGFRIERGSLPAGPFSLLTTVGANVTAYSDVINADAGGTQYCYRVQAYNAAGQSGFSNVACGTSPIINVPVPPSAPGGLSVSVTVSVTVSP